MDVISTIVTHLRGKGRAVSAARPAGPGVYVTVEDTEPVGVRTVAHSVRLEVYGDSPQQVAEEIFLLVADCEELPQIGWWGVVKAPSPAPASPQGFACWDAVLEYID